MTGPARRTRPYGMLAVLAAVVVFPWLPFVEDSMVATANLATYYAIVAMSLVMLTGWVGQISLGHAGLVGVGAYVTGHVVNGWHITFPVNVLWAAVAGGAVAVALGVVAVRVRGLYLAVATLIFTWMAAEFLFRQSWFTRNAAIELKPFGEEGTFPYFDFTSRRTYYFAAWAAVGTVFLLLSNLRDSKTGRAFLAVRGSEVAAASLGVNVVRTKVVAFAISGALAGVAGNLLLLQNRTVTPESFEVDVSLFFLAIAVVGGLSSLGGAVSAAILFALLNEAFLRFDFLAGWLEVVPPLLLGVVLLAYPGGLGAMPAAIGRRLLPVTTAIDERWQAALSEGPLANLRRSTASWREDLASSWRSATSRASGAVRRLAPGGRPAGVAAEPVTKPGSIEPLDVASMLRRVRGEVTAAQVVETPQAEEAAAVERLTWESVEDTEWYPPGTPREERPVLLEARNVTVRFGGLVAANDVSLTVRENEIVGLIGPNGAGKTTTFNAIAGLNVPAGGRVYAYGRDVTSWSVDQRARLGLGRTFQAIQLLPQLTVFQNLLVATHVRNTSGLFAHLFVGPTTLQGEIDARRRVHEVAELLDLEEYLDRTVADLPFGVLRMIELARALVTGSRVIMLDEPASGLDDIESDRLAQILKFLRALGVTLLLIEHDVRLVTSISDYMYVLDHGALLAEGTPAEIQRDPRVIAAYLGGAEEPETAADATAEPEAEEVLS